MTIADRHQGGGTDDEAKLIIGHRLVFNSTASSGIEALVKNCAGFRVEVDFVEFPANEPDAIYQGSIIRVRDTRLSASTFFKSRNRPAAYIARARNPQA